MCSNFNEEIKFISHKCEKGDYPKGFINSAIRCNIDDFDDYVIPPNISNIPKFFILKELPFFENNEVKSKHFLKKFEEYFEVALRWTKTRLFKTLFPLKDKSIHKCDI